MRKFNLLVAAFVVAAITAGSVLAGNGAGTRQSNALEHGGASNFWCDLSGYIGHGPLSSSTYTFAWQRARNTWVATVQLRNAEPNASYYIYIVQNNTDCGDPNGSFTTNANGKGGGTATDPAIGTTAGLWVGTVGGDYFQAPSFLTHP